MNIRNQLAALVAGAILVATVGIVAWASQWQYVATPDRMIFRFNRFTNQKQVFLCGDRLPVFAISRGSSCSFEDR